MCNAQNAQHKIILNGKGPAVKTVAFSIGFENWTWVLFILGQCYSLLHMSYFECPLPVCHLSPKKLDRMEVFLYVLFLLWSRGISKILKVLGGWDTNSWPPAPRSCNICNGHISSSGKSPSATVTWSSQIQVESPPWASSQKTQGVRWKSKEFLDKRREKQQIVCEDRHCIIQKSWTQLHYVTPQISAAKGWKKLLYGTWISCNLCKEIYLSNLLCDTTSKSGTMQWNYNQTLLSLSKLCPQLCYNFSGKLLLGNDAIPSDLLLVESLESFVLHLQYFLDI